MPTSKKKALLSRDTSALAPLYSSWWYQGDRYCTPAESMDSKMSGSCLAGGMGGVSKEEYEAAAAKLRELMGDGMTVPDRGNLDDEAIKWRIGKPDYTLANLRYFEGRTREHAEGSLEHIIENAVKTWEMEGSHKVDMAQWTTINQERYRVKVNDSEWFGGKESAEMGNYNWLLSQCPREKYDSSKETFESSHALFRDAFPKGFAWEVLDVFSGPPKVHFSWRHWAYFSGEYRGHKGSGKLVELFGFGVVSLDESLKICDLEIYYKPEKFLDSLERPTATSPGDA
eukprot:Sspe_Gene.7883::Locus_2677_Transcript_1_1_Confidence_1.000_Length_2861::g.7883::m.7883